MTPYKACKGCDCLKVLDDILQAKKAGYWKRQAKTLTDRIAIYIETDGRGKCVSDESAKGLADEIRRLFSYKKEER
jgi:hypothetical protein